MSGTSNKYSILDTQTANVLHSGANSTSREEALKEAYPFIADGDDGTYIDHYPTDDIEKYINEKGYEVIIHKQLVHPLKP
jgi:hypothetical protein